MLAKLTSFFWTRPKTMETSVVRLPPDLPNWFLVKELLKDLQGRLINENISDQETCCVMYTVYNTIQSERRWSGSKDSLLNRLKSQIKSNAQKKLDHNCIWFGLLKYLRKVSKDERDKFLYTILPNIIEFAVGIEDCRPAGLLHINRRQHGGSVKLTRQFACSIVACFFLCLFPERKRELSNVNIINFTTFFRHLPHPPQIAKLRCVLHYFECVAEKGTEIQGNLVFCRKVAPPDWMLTFDELIQCDLKLCPLYIHAEGAVEDSGPDTLQVCFGNKSMGGGVLGRSVVQEEILFSTCPELMAAMLFMENMETNEAIFVSGFHRYSSYSGYGDSLEFTGHYSRPNQIHTMVTMDAASYRETPVSKQYEESSVLRDLNKALIGFSWAPGADGGKLQPWDMCSKDGESPGAADMAADIVTSAMTDALQQASGSPVDPEAPLPSVHSFQHPCSQHHHHHHLPQSLSSHHSQQQQDLSCKSRVYLQDTDAVENLFAAETAHMEQNSSVTCSGSLLTAHSMDCNASSSSSVSSGVNVSIARSLQPLSSISTISALPATTSTYCPQISVHGSDSLFVQQHEMVGLPEEKCQGFTKHSSAREHLTHSSPAASSVSERTSGNQNHLAAAIESSAFIRASELLPSLQAHADSKEKLSYDVLGNLSRIPRPSSAGVFVEPACDQTGEHRDVLHSTEQHEMSQLPGHHAGHPCPGNAEDVKDIVIELPITSTAGAVFCSTSPSMNTEKTKYDELAFSQNVRSLTDNKYEGLVHSIDVVLSLPALQSEFERMSSGLSSSSLAVNIDSQSASAEEESIRQLSTEYLYVNVDNNELPVEAWNYRQDKSDGRTASIDSVLLEPPFSSSPQSLVSSANVSPNTSFLVSEPFHPEPPNRSSDVHAVADFFIPSSDGLSGQPRQSSRRGSRDFYGELRDYLSSSSSGSRGSGSGGPLSSTNSSWGSRSGSLSSHGTNGSTIDFPEFWSNFRRRSSQLSDTTSRRSSSSKHSSDFNTDLEEIAEGTHRHDHEVIEEEGNWLSLVAEFATNFVSVAIRNGVAIGAHMIASSKHHMEEHGNHVQLYTDKVDSEHGDQNQLNTELLDSDLANKDLLFSTSTEQEEHLEAALSTVPDSSSAQRSKDHGLTEPWLQVGCSSPTRSSSKYLRASGAHISPSLASHTQESATVRSVLAGVQPSASHSIDSGFSSGVSSITFISERKTLESLSEEPSVSSSANFSVTNSEGLPSESVTSYPAPDNAGSSVNMPGSLFSRKLYFDASSDSTVGKANIPLSPTNDKRLYTVLESKTVFLDAENMPKLTSMEQMQFDPSDSGTQRTFIPSHAVQKQKKETSELTEHVKPRVHICKKKVKHSKNSSVADVPRCEPDVPRREPDVPRRELKHFRRQKAEDETSGDLDPCYQQKAHEVVETSLAAEAGAAVCSSPQPVTPHPVSGAVAPGKCSGIPKFRDKRLSCAESSVQARSKNLSSQKPSSAAVKEKQKDIKKDRALKDSTSSHSRVSTNKALLKPHKSRYIFSDVAAPLADTRKSKTASEIFTKKHNDKKALKKQDEKRRKQRSDSTRHDPLKFTRSQKFIRFVNSIAEISVSQAVLQGAEILAHRSTGHRDISDELYNWFATKIVAEVFLHVVRELGVHRSDQGACLSSPRENGALDDASVSELKEDHVTSRLESSRGEEAVPKPKSILPTKPDAQASESKVSGQVKLCGSLKMVKFKDSQDDSSLSLPHSQAHIAASTSANTSATPTFQRQSSCIPIPIRRRNSLDLPLSSSSSPPGANGLTSSKLPLKCASSQQKHASLSCTASLTSRDLSIDVYQTAAAIVSQVLQAVSDSLDIQALSPVSSGWHGTLSSSDTAIHSTGSRINSNYDSMNSNIFSSSSAKASESPRRARRSVSPCIGIFTRKPMSRETLTNAFLKVDSTQSFKTYERRSSEPCQTSVQLSLQAFNSIKFSKQAVEDKQRKISRTDDDIGRGKTWRRGSLDGFSFERRNSCGFKDPVLSRFAEELMKADTSVPELVIVGSNASSSSDGSRRSSFCAFKEFSQANVDSELLNTSFTSLPVSHSSRSQGRQMNMDRSCSRESRNWKSDSSDTEYWFPPPKIVGDEFQQEYNRQHSQEELHDYASFFAGRVVQEAVCVLKCDPNYMSKDELDVELFAENLMDQIMRDALIASIRGDHSHLVSDHGGGGDGSQNNSAQAEDCVVEGDQGDAKQKVYHTEGARPKTSFTSLRAQTKTKSIPQRRDARRRDNELKYQRTEDRSYVSRHVTDQRMGRASTIGGYETSQYLHVSPQPAASSSNNSRQRSIHRQSVQKNTADSTPPSSKHKRHSTPGFSLQPPPLSTLPPSAHAASASHLVQSGTSQCEDYPHEKYTQKARSKVESSSSAASGIPVYRGLAHSEPSHSKKLTKARREESCASSASSVSSYQSEHSGSSLPSSSGSEGIGPTGKDTQRKYRAKRESECRNKTSHKSDSTKTNSAHKERSRQRDSHARRTDAGTPKRRSARDRGQHAEVTNGQRIAVDQFSTNLSVSVMDDALLCYRNDHWLRFFSYQKPIATGNWGCGAFRGNAQLKLVIQWMAASVSRAPALMYYTFNDERLLQAEEVVQLISGQTVGQLATALRDYCSWVRLNLASSSSSSSSLLTRPQLHHQPSHQTKMLYSAWKSEQEYCLPQSLFDFLLEKFRTQGDR